MNILQRLGLNPELLDSSDFDSLERVSRELKFDSNSRLDPNRVISSLREAGIDVDSLIKKMKGGGEPKRKSEQARGRNDPCFCGSGRKYKKCCL